MPSTDQTGRAAGYEAFFGLKEAPFALAPDPRFLFASASHSAALAQVAYAIDRREPLVVVTGEIGTGKTLLCRAVLQRLPRKTFVSIVDDPLLGPDDLLKQLLGDFGVISRDRGQVAQASRHDLVQALHAFLRSLAAIQAHAVVIIDEAQHLAPAVLEQIRLLSNIDDERGTLLQVILVGQTDVEPLLSRPELRQIQQRVSRRFRLEPLSREEVRQYIEHRMARAREGVTQPHLPGGDELARALAGWHTEPQPAVFEPHAIEAIAEITDGLPRLINLVCDRSLEEAYEARRQTVDVALVRAAARALRLREPSAPEQPAAISETVPRVSSEPAVPRAPEPVRAMPSSTAPADSVSHEGPVPLPAPAVVEPTVSGELVQAASSEAAASKATEETAPSQASTAPSQTPASVAPVPPPAGKQETPFWPGQPQQVPSFDEMLPAGSSAGREPFWASQQPQSSGFGDVALSGAIAHGDGAGEHLSIPPDIAAADASHAVEPAPPGGRWRRPVLAATIVVIAAVAIWIGFRGAGPRSTVGQPAPPPAPSRSAATPPAGTSSTPAHPNPPAPAAPSTPANVPPPNTAPTHVVPAPSPAAPTSKPAPPAAGSFEIVVASFRTEPRATSVQGAIASLGLPARRRVLGPWQQVVCGPFPSRSRAEEAQQRLDRAGYSGTQIVVATQ